MRVDMACNILNSYEKCIKTRSENDALRTTGSEIQTISLIITKTSLKFPIRCNNGEHHLITCGIPMDCSLSPLMGALALKSLDAVVEKDCAYIRYMDDWVTLTRTKSALRRMVKKMHRVLQTLKFKLAIDKTFIGKISKGFDFLGYRFNDQGIIGLAEKTILNFHKRIARLYEQKASNLRLEQYVKRWAAWANVSILS